MLLTRVGLVLTDILIRNDFIISRDSGLVAKDAFDYQEQPAQKERTRLWESNQKKK